MVVVAILVAERWLDATQFSLTRSVPFQLQHQQHQQHQQMPLAVLETCGRRDLEGMDGLVEKFSIIAIAGGGRGRVPRGFGVR